jgi:putative acetyltransferase
MRSGVLDIFQATQPHDWNAARALLALYGAELERHFGLTGVTETQEALEAAYPAPGGLWLASSGEPVGCVALRPLGPKEGELKRLFMLPGARGRGVGRSLLETALGAARAAGFRSIRLDTLPGMEAAQALYAALGFRPCAPYGARTLPGARFLELLLDAAGTAPRDGGPSRG